MSASNSPSEANPEWFLGKVYLFTGDLDPVRFCTLFSFYVLLVPIPFHSCQCLCHPLTRYISKVGLLVSMSGLYIIVSRRVKNCQMAVITLLELHFGRRDMQEGTRFPYCRRPQSGPSQRPRGLELQREGIVRLEICDGHCVQISRRSTPKSMRGPITDSRHSTATWDPKKVYSGLLVCMYRMAK